VSQSLNRRDCPDVPFPSASAARWDLQNPLLARFRMSPGLTVQIGAWTSGPVRVSVPAGEEPPVAVAAVLAQSYVMTDAEQPLVQ
jgi:hypothetical protein